MGVVASADSSRAKQVGLMDLSHYGAPELQSTPGPEATQYRCDGSDRCSRTDEYTWECPTPAAHVTWNVDAVHVIRGSSDNAES
jgi:hypothetical protein